MSAEHRRRQAGEGLKLLVVCDKHGSLLDLELHPANTDDRMGALPMLPRLAVLGFERDLLGDDCFRGASTAAAALAHDIHVSVLPGGIRDGRFLLRGISWVMESLAGVNQNIRGGGCRHDGL